MTPPKQPLNQSLHVLVTTTMKAQLDAARRLPGFKTEADVVRHILDEGLSAMLPPDALEQQEQRRVALYGDALNDVPMDPSSKLSANGHTRYFEGEPDPHPYAGRTRVLVDTAEEPKQAKTARREPVRIPGREWKDPEPRTLEQQADAMAKFASLDTTGLEPYLQAFDEHVAALTQEHGEIVADRPAPTDEEFAAATAKMEPFIKNLYIGIAILRAAHGNRKAIKVAVPADWTEKVAGGTIFGCEIVRGEVEEPIAFVPTQ